MSIEAGARPAPTPPSRTQMPARDCCGTKSSVRRCHGAGQPMRADARQAGYRQLGRAESSAVPAIGCQDPVAVLMAKRPQPGAAAPATAIPASMSVPRNRRFPEARSTSNNKEQAPARQGPTPRFLVDGRTGHPARADAARRRAGYAGTAPCSPASHNLGRVQLASLHASRARLA